jgi:hypothetical protein
MRSSQNEVSCAQRPQLIGVAGIPKLDLCRKPDVEHGPLEQNRGAISAFSC